MSGHQRLPANIEHEIRIISVEIWKDSRWRNISECDEGIDGCHHVYTDTVGSYMFDFK